MSALEEWRVLSRVKSSFECEGPGRKQARKEGVKGSKVCSADDLNDDVDECEEVFEGC